MDSLWYVLFFQGENVLKIFKGRPAIHCSANYLINRGRSSTSLPYLLFFCTSLCTLPVRTLPASYLTFFSDSWLIPSLGFLTIFFITMIPFMIVSSASILADFSAESNKSMIQGIRISFERLAQLLGPLWAANMLHNTAIIFIFPV